MKLFSQILRLLSYLVSVVILSIASLMMLKGLVKELYFWVMFLSMLAFLIFYKIIIKSKSNLFKKTIWVDIVIIAIIAFGLRLAYVLWAEVEQISDYATFLDSAMQIAKGNQLHFRGVAYMAAFKHILGYVYFLSLGFGLFGSGVFVGQMINIVLATATVILLYRLVSTKIGRHVGVLAGILFAVFPGNVFFSALIFQGNLVTFLLVLSLYIYHCVDDRVWFKYLVLGLCLAFWQIMRPLAIVMLVAIVLTEILKTTDRIAKIKRIAATMLSFLVLPAVFYQIVFSSIQAEPAGFSYFTALVGISETGAWNEADALKFGQYLDSDYGQKIPNINGKMAQLRIKDDFWNRVKTKRFDLKFWLNKIKFMWAGDSAGLMVGSASRELLQYSRQLKIVADSYYFLVMVVALIGMFISWRNGKTLLDICVLFLAGFGMIHLIIEVSWRYHLMALPILSVISSFALSRIIVKAKNSPKRDIIPNNEQLFNPNCY